MYNVKDSFLKIKLENFITFKSWREQIYTCFMEVKSKWTGNLDVDLKKNKICMANS